MRNDTTIQRLYETFARLAGVANNLAAYMARNP